MIIYLATPTTIFSYDKNITRDTYILETYHELKNKKDLSFIQPDYFLLDSGAYTYMRGNGGDQSKTNWDQYIEEYAQFILKNNIKYFFELDIDSLIGYQNVLKLTEKLNNLVGIKCIPVWHKSRGLQAWKDMLDQYDYVSLSASGNNGSSEWTRTPAGIKIMHELNLMALKKGVKVHALGYTKIPVLKQIKFHSCDSTSWTFSLRSGSAHQFKNGSIVRIPKPEGTNCNTAIVSLYSYNEWKKLQQHFINHH